MRTQEGASAYLLYTERRIERVDVRCEIGLEEERNARRGVSFRKGGRDRNGNVRYATKWSVMVRVRKRQEHEPIVTPPMHDAMQRCAV